MDPMSVNPTGPKPVGGGKRPAESAGTDGPGFKETLNKYLDQVNELQQEADKAVVDMAAGNTSNLHQVVAAVNEADLSFRLMMQVRNKLLDAYKEIMRMQV